MATEQIKVVMEAPEVTLVTQGKYCPSDIVVSALLQDKEITTNGTISADDGYVGLGTITINVDQGAAAPVLEELTREITENGVVEIVPDSGYDAISKATITVAVPQGIDTSDATATAAQMLSGATAYVKDEKITGTIPTYSGYLRSNIETVSFDNENVESITYDGEDVSSVSYLYK